MEIWKDIPGYEGRYQVSNEGRVKSFARKEPTIMSQKIDRGYARVGLRHKSSREQTHYAIHRLVAEAFIPNPGNKPVVNHLDGCKTNNYATNLEWATLSENDVHAYKHGLRKPTNGTINGQSKLTEDAVRNIRKRVANGETQRSVAEDYPISFQTVNDIVLGKRWGWLE